jgi:hypothetical protein
MLDKVSIPVCICCDELIAADDAIRYMANGDPLHWECMCRLVLGSVAHQERRCHCYIPGSTEEDPAGLTKRQAAQAALDTYRIRTFPDFLNKRGSCPLCGCFEFHPGPRGGAARNIKCAQCGVKLWYSPPFIPSLVFNEDQFYDLAVRERLQVFDP